MAETVLSRVDVGRQPYFLQTTLFRKGAAGFQLVLTDALNAWAGEISESEIGKLAKKGSMEKEDFIEQSKKALTQMELDNLTFEYQAKDLEDGGKEFSWKKVTGSIKFQLGCVNMEPVDDPSESIQDLFIFSIGHMAKLREDIHRLQVEKKRMSTERDNALKRLERCVSLKEDLEQDLYSKFQIVLNDKKAKIRRLKEEVRDTKEQLEDAVQNGVVPNRAGPSTEDVTRRSGNESEEEMDISDEDTDDERKKAKETQRRRKKTTVTVAPSRQSADSSLLLGEDDEDQPVTTNKRRRKREPQRKETERQKPAIPRVPSNTTPGKTPSSTQRTRSGRSRQESQEAEADISDLIENI